MCLFGMRTNLGLLFLRLRLWKFFCYFSLVCPKEFRRKACFWNRAITWDIYKEYGPVVVETPQGLEVKSTLCPWPLHGPAHISHVVSTPMWITFFSFQVSNHYPLLPSSGWNISFNYPMGPCPPPYSWGTCIHMKLNWIFSG